MFNVVLVHPQIPPNTGNVIRLCANTGAALHLVQPLGFDFDDKQLRRAGLDYHEFAQVQLHADWAAFLSVAGADALLHSYALTTKGTRSPYEVALKPNDYLIFGAETTGLPPELRGQFPPGHLLRLPMLPTQRSLNLSNAVAITLFEALRQQGFAGLG